MKDLKDRNQYKMKIRAIESDNNNPLRICRCFFPKSQKIVFFFAFDYTISGNKRAKVEKNSHKKYFLPRVNITN